MSSIEMLDVVGRLGVFALAPLVIFLTWKHHHLHHH